MQPAAGLLEHLGHRIVVEGRAQVAKLRIIDLAETLAAEAHDVRVHDLAPDADLVHQVQARFDEGGRRGRLGQRPVGEVRALDLDVVPVHHSAGAGLPEEDVLIDDPDVVGVPPALGWQVLVPVGPLDDSRDAVAVGSRSARGPQITGLGEVGVGIDHIDTLGGARRICCHVAPCS